MTITQGRWLKTLGLAVIGALLPFASALSAGQPINAKVIVGSVIVAALTTVAKLASSPLEQPPPKPDIEIPDPAKEQK